MTVPEAEWPAKPTALFADLYELTMMQAYLREGLTAKSVFSLFPRRLPPTRNYLIARGSFPRSGNAWLPGWGEYGVAGV